MLWLNRLQQRLSLTRNEALALLSLSALLTIGIVARHLQQRVVPVPVGAYDEMDRLFFQRSESADDLPNARLSGNAGDTSSVATNGSPAGDDPGSESPLNRDDPGASAAPAHDEQGTDGTLRVDLNTAGTRELVELPRIGPQLAARILAFRADYGPFLDVDDLQQVRGIGERTVELLRPHVYVSAPVDSPPP